MDVTWIADALDYDSAIALGGCRCGTSSFECCEYNVFVFDGARRQDEMRVDGKALLVHHDSIDTPASGVFTHIPDMHIVKDDSWEVRSKASNLAEKRDEIFRHAKKSAFMDSLVLLHTARTALDSKPAEAPLWMKCAAYRIADSISYHNMREPSPAHMMAHFRDMPKSEANATLDTVSECLGLERATPSLLARMTRSTLHLANVMHAGKIATEIIEQKAAHLGESSMLTDCHYYIARVSCMTLCSRNNTVPLSDSEIRVLREALDSEGNTQDVTSHIASLEGATSRLAPLFGWEAPLHARKDTF